MARRKQEPGIGQRNGIFFIRYDGPIGPDGERRQKRESLGRGATFEDAKALLRKREMERDLGICSDATNATLAEYLQDWLRLGSDDRSPTTNERYEQLIRLQINPSIGSVKLNRLKPLQIQGFLTTMRESGRKDGKEGGLSPKTIKHLHTLLHAALEQAVKWQLIPINPARAVASPKVPKHHVRTAEDDDLARLLAAIETSYYRIPILLIIATGMRRGEVCGLQWSDFDADNGTLTIRRALINTKDGVQVKGTKTDKDRTILLPADIVAELVKHKAEQGVNQEDWICLNATGGKLAPKSIDKAYRNIRLGIGVETTLHQLRHTWATRQILAGVPDDIVAAMLGHSSTTTTHNIYTHPRVSNQEATHEVTSEILSQKPKIKVVK